MRHCILLCLLACASGAIVGAETPRPVPSEPTPEETLMLEYINRFRADPAADAARMVEHAKARDAWLVEHVDLEKFSKEMQDVKAVGPLVFSPALIGAARGHANYMVLNALTHEQEKDRPGFTGKTFSDRCRSTGYQGFATAENVFRDAVSVWDGHVGYVVDYGGSEAGGMQPGRGHRKILSMWNLKEVGIGIVPHTEDKFSIAEDFGDRTAVRMVGGVVYVDLNGNNFYDVGEGVGGVTVKASDGSASTTWASGAYAMDLKSDQKVTLTAEFGGQSFSREEKPGRNTIKFDWIMPTEMASAVADKLIAAAQSAPAAEKTAALNALYLCGQRLPLDAERHATIDALTKDFAADLARRQTAVREALSGEHLEKLDALITEQRAPYKGTPVDDWFKDAQKTGEVRRGLLELKAGVEARRLSDARRRSILSSIETIARGIGVAEFRELLDKQMRDFGM